MQSYELDERVLRWVIDKVGADILSIKQMPGATSSLVHCIVVNNQEQSFILRQYNNKKWLDEEPEAAEHEADNLLMAEKVAVNTPKLIAFDKTGKQCGLPVLLMNKLAGEVVLKPKDMGKWLAGMAEALACIHQLEAAEYRWQYFTYMNLSTFPVPTWSNLTASWQRIIAKAKETPPKSRGCFIHRDYHPTNILWQGNKVSGVVDWASSCYGPAGVDVGHCRVNLAMLYDASTADKFLAAYQYYAGPSFNYDAYWDIISLIDILFGPPQVYPGWQAFGISGLTNEIMVKRVEDYMKSLLERI